MAWGYLETRDHKLNTPPALRLDWIGWTRTMDTPVIPIATEMSCRAVWNPETFELLGALPSVSLLANANRPPLPKPDGS
jgi:hypothetical protein